ncbi:MAG: hypothetical protein TECD_00252 [Hyphomicrobiaceae bacterium hypho_1]
MRSYIKSLNIERWIYPNSSGLYCSAGNFYIDPHRPVAHCVVTHGHADHARTGHGHVIATPETVRIMKIRMGKNSAECFTQLEYGERYQIGGTEIQLVPSGHILGSAQVVIDHQGQRVVVSGDYKRTYDPTCLPFKLVCCDVFVTEATFGLPVFRHEPAEKEIARLLNSMLEEPDRTYLIGVYGLGKCQRVITLLRQAGYERPVWLHSALKAMCDLYTEFNINLGQYYLASNAEGKLEGELILCPPSALNSRWSRRFNNPVIGLASGWMRVRGRARQRGVELPLVISDHADWYELIQTIRETCANNVWVTHGREEALIRQLKLMGINGRALHIIGREEGNE